MSHEDTARELLAKHVKPDGVVADPTALHDDLVIALLIAEGRGLNRLPPSDRKNSRAR